MNVDRVVEAIRTIHKHHDLGDAIYAVRDRAANTMPAGDEGNSWDHPDVVAYGLAYQALREEGVLAK